MQPSKAELEWDVNASTSRTIEALLATQFAVVWGLVLLVGTSLLLAIASRYVTGTTMLELVGILALVMGVPILAFWGVLRTLTGTGRKRMIAQYFFFDPAHPERTIFDHAPPRQYAVAAAVGFVGYFGSIFVFESQPEYVLGVAFAGAVLCCFFWWTAPNRGRLDVESETLVIYNRRTLTEGGGGNLWDLLRGFSGDDRRTSLKDVVGTTAVRVGDVVVLALQHRAGYAPTLVVLPPRVANRIVQEYGD
ncbi:hypothetical protein Natoc_4115 (plasmid) [Natronococcus occultus SP4]|uniref:Uncharacterized protein n=2 Tax=Natronococcus occultus TaxID=29288 RepID=L0K5N0_9EURY|nr:hypothetical protein Natoc_4115 [Natronococcus occultus SP4]